MLASLSLAIWIAPLGAAGATQSPSVASTDATQPSTTEVATPEADVDAPAHVATPEAESDATASQPQTPDEGSPETPSTEAAAPTSPSEPTASANSQAAPGNAATTSPSADAPKAVTPPSSADTDGSAPAATTPPTDNEDNEPRRTYPRIVIAGGPMVGPHSLGNEECSSEQAKCEKKGSFFGVGGQVEVRGRLWRALGIHVRGLAVKNVAPTDRVYSGLVGGGIGLGAYGKRAFGRAEYLFLQPLGDNRFEPPFFDGEVARDTWGRSAGLLSVGFRQPLPHRLAVELWGGLMIGPKSIREVPQQDADKRVLTTFQIGLNIAWDAWP